MGSVNLSVQDAGPSLAILIGLNSRYFSKRPDFSTSSLSRLNTKKNMSLRIELKSLFGCAGLGPRDPLPAGRA